MTRRKLAVVAAAAALLGIGAAAVAAVTLPDTTAKPLLIGGSPTAPPAAGTTPTFVGTMGGWVGARFQWPAAAGATGYRVYLDGVQIALTAATDVVVATTCGQQHRVNAQPFNNRGFAVLAKPLYVTPACPPPGG